MRADEGDDGQDRRGEERRAMGEKRIAEAEGREWGGETKVKRKK